MSFLQDYLTYNLGNESPKPYHRWTALVLIAAAIGNRVHIDYGYTRIYSNLYVGLIGKQGTRKSSAKDIGRDIFQKAFPDYPLGASVQSCNDVIKNLASDTNERSYMNEEGAAVSWKPMVFFVNELKNFLSINPTMMIDFLTDIYDRNGKVFDSSTIKHGLQNIENPCINLLACETPEWIIDKLKYNVISGGFCRRIIYIYEIEESERIAFPMQTQEGKEALARCLEHLKKLPSIVGKFEWEPAAKLHFTKWYNEYVRSDDPLMGGFDSSIHTQAMKVAMVLALCEPNPKLILTEELLICSIAMLELAKVNMPRLSIAAGRNELAVPQQNVLEVLERFNGIMLMSEFSRKLDRDFTPNEKAGVLKNLQDNGTIKIIMVKWPLDKPDGTAHSTVVSAQTYIKMFEKKNI